MKIIPLTYENTPVRVLLDNQGQTWFIATDICRVLDIGNTTMALKPLDEDEKKTITLNIIEGGLNIIEGAENQSVSEPWGQKVFNIINEPGLYRLIFNSRKPEARSFQRWVIHDVLPTLRKTGKYVLSHAATQNGPTPPNELPRIQPPHLLAGFYRGTTLARLTRTERELVGQGVHDFGLTPEQARQRALTILQEQFGAPVDRLFSGLPIIVPERKTSRPRLAAPSSSPSITHQDKAPTTANTATVAARPSSGQTEGQTGQKTTMTQPPFLGIPPLLRPIATPEDELIERFLDHEELNPTQIGERIGLSPIEVNKIIESAGLQHKVPDAHKGYRWEPTEQGSRMAIQKQGKTKNGETYSFILWRAKPLMAKIATRVTKIKSYPLALN